MNMFVFVLALAGLGLLFFGIRYLYKKYGPKGSVRGSSGGGGGKSQPK